MLSNNLIQVNPFLFPMWDSAVLHGPRPQFFHLSCWIQTLVQAYNLQPFCFIIETDPVCVIPILIAKTFTGGKKAISLPFTDGSDIVCQNLQPDALLSKLLTVSRSEKIERLEFRGTTLFQPSKKITFSYWGHRLDLKKEEILWKHLSASKKRNVKKAERSKTTIKFHSEKNAVREYYRLHCITRKRHGLPPQPVLFFDALYSNIISRNMGEVALAYSDNKPIAGAVFLITEREVIFKFGASDKNQQHTRANDLLMWEAIRRYSEKGFATFSFGKTEKMNDGLCRYKEGFGAQKIPLNDYYFNTRTGDILQNKSQMLHGFHNTVFRNMPVAFSQLCGELIYKYFA